LSYNKDKNVDSIKIKEKKTKRKKIREEENDLMWDILFQGVIERREIKEMDGCEK
jgi:hypothetical protein